MAKLWDESDLIKMGYVCTRCGKPKNLLKSCRRGCTKICEDCLREMGRSFVFCKECRDMTLQRWQGTN